MAIFGNIGPAKCGCTMKWKAMWFIKEAGVVCSNCGTMREMSVPPQGLMTMPCGCTAGAEATWFITASGNYICSNCGTSR